MIVFSAENSEDIPTCEVDGKIYKDGEYFKPAAEPNKNCYCAPGYTGKEEIIFFFNLEQLNIDK